MSKPCRDRQPWLRIPALWGHNKYLKGGMPIKVPKVFSHMLSTQLHSEHAAAVTVQIGFRGCHVVAIQYNRVGTGYCVCRLNSHCPYDKAVTLLHELSASYFSFPPPLLIHMKHEAESRVFCPARTIAHPGDLFSDAHSMTRLWPGAMRTPMEPADANGSWHTLHKAPQNTR